MSEIEDELHEVEDVVGGVSEDESESLAVEPDLPEESTIDLDDFEASEFVETHEEPCDYKIMEQLLDESEESDSHSQVVGDSATISTTEYITKFEKTRVLGWRSQQLKTGAPPMIREDEEFNGVPAFPGKRYPKETYEIAKTELKFGRCPIIIGRRLPNGEKMLVKASKLKL